MERKCSLRWYRLAKDDGTEGNIRSLQGYEEVRLCRLRIGSAELLQDKRRLRMCSDDRCMMCDSGDMKMLTIF